MLSDELIPAATTNYFIGLIRLNYKLRPEGQALTLEMTHLELFPQLNDVGKISMPSELLNKPGKLMNEEFEVIKSHSNNG